MTPTKASYAEGRIRRLKLSISQFLTANKTSRYIDDLQEIVNGINDSPMPALNNLTPNQVNFKNQNAVWKYRFGDLEKLRSRSGKKHYFQVGDVVRLRVKVVTEKFRKGYTPNYSITQYRISSIIRAPGADLYRLVSLAGNPIRGRSVS